jgi:type IV conjugative transfer system protein TraL
MSSQHRIGFDLDGPLRIMGFTKDELLLLFLGLAGFIFSSNKILGGCLLGVCFLLLIVVKRFKARVVGFNLLSFVWWHFGLTTGPSTLPPSHSRKMN